MIYSVYIQTVDAEIKHDMPPQRTRDAESRVGNSLANGPRRAQSNAMGKVFCDDSMRQLHGYEVPQKSTEVNQGGTADILYVRPWQKENVFLSFFVFWRNNMFIMSKRWRCRRINDKIIFKLTY